MSDDPYRATKDDEKTDKRQRVSPRVLVVSVLIGIAPTKKWKGTQRFLNRVSGGDKDIVTVSAEAGLVP